MKNPEEEWDLARLTAEHEAMAGHAPQENLDAAGPAAV